MNDSKCKICRRLGSKLFLKGEKCLSVKCPLTRKPYPPGQKKKRRTASSSEYSKELKEKQKFKKFYHLKEKQFRNYVKKALGSGGKRENADVLLVKMLESRLDNVVFRLGFASSRLAGRQMVSHGFILINEKPINIPSYLVKKGDKIKIKPTFSKKNIFKDLPLTLKKQKPPQWLKLDVGKLEGEVIGEPTLEELALPTEIPIIFEFYSK